MAFEPEPQEEGETGRDGVNCVTKNGHKIVTIGCKSLRRNASMGFDSPASI